MTEFYNLQLITIVEGTFGNQCYGWIDDDIAFIQPWGFSLADISVPVHIWQGDDDFMVPKAHSYWFEKHIPTGALNFVPGHGHISLIADYKNEIISQAEELLR